MCITDVAKRTLPILHCNTIYGLDQVQSFVRHTNKFLPHKRSLPHYSRRGEMCAPDDGRKEGGHGFFLHAVLRI